MVESASDSILSDANKIDVAFLVVGDPFGYAAHTFCNLFVSLKVAWLLLDYILSTNFDLAQQRIQIFCYELVNLAYQLDRSLTHPF